MLVSKEQGQIKKSMIIVCCKMSELSKRRFPDICSAEHHQHRMGPVDNDYATIKRYQEGHEIITDDDILATIDAAKAVLEWAQQEVAQQLRSATDTTK